jgi:FAD:protein FMN transferase
MKNSTRIILGLILVSISLASCRTGVKEETDSRIEIDGEAQGTYFHIVYYDSLKRDLRPGIDNLLKGFDHSASAWVENSVLSRINRNEEGALADDIFIANFELAQRIAKETGGAFDITVGPLVNAWGFGFKQGIELDRHKVDSLKKLVGYRKIKLDGRHLIKADPRMQVDFNAIAQGYSVDLMAAYLENQGITNYLVDIGGEVFCKGSKPGNVRWNVDIERPQDDPKAPQVSMVSLRISGKAVATSGSYRKFYEKDGMRYSHTINPATGYPVRHNLLSATVIASTCAEADAYATALMVMGVAGSQKFLDNHPELEAYLIYQVKDGSLQTWMTDGMAGYVAGR